MKCNFSMAIDINQLEQDLHFFIFITQASFLQHDREIMIIKISFVILISITESFEQ